MSNYPTTQPQEEAFSPIGRGLVFTQDRPSMLSTVAMAAFLIKTEIFQAYPQGERHAPEKMIELEGGL